MDLKQKLQRIREIDKLNFPSQEQIEERLRLEDEIELELRESGLHLDQFNTQEPKEAKEIFQEVYQENKKNQPPVKVYRGLISGRIEKWKDEKRERDKATPQMIQQLRLEVDKAKLEAQLALFKKLKKENKSSRLNFHLPKKIFQDEEAQDSNQNNGKKKKKQGSYYRQVEESLRAPIGTTNEKDYDIFFNKK